MDQASDHGVCRHGPRFPHFFHARSSCLARRTVGSRDPIDSSLRLLSAGQDCVSCHRERNRPVHTAGDTGLDTGALRTRSARLAPVSTTLTKRTYLPRSNRSRTRKCSRNRSISGSFAPRAASTPFRVTSENTPCLRKRPLIGTASMTRTFLSRLNNSLTAAAWVSNPERRPYIGIHITECYQQRRRAGGAREKRRPLDEVTYGRSSPSARSVDFLAEGSCDSGQVCRRNSRASPLPSLVCSL